MAARLLLSFGVVAATSQLWVFTGSYLFFFFCPGKLVCRKERRKSCYSADFMKCSRWNVFSEDLLIWKIYSLTEPQSTPSLVGLLDCHFQNVQGWEQFLVLQRTITGGAVGARWQLEAGVPAESGPTYHSPSSPVKRVAGRRRGT